MYREYGEKVKNLAQGLLSLGLEKGDKVNILSATCFEWVVSDFSVLTAGGVVVTVTLKVKGK